MRPINVLFCIDSLDFAGTEKQVLELIGGLDRDGFRPFLATLKPSALDPAVAACPWHEAAFRSFGNVAVVGEIAGLRRFIRRNEIDVIQTYFPDATLFGFLAGCGSGRRRHTLASFRDLGFWRTPFKSLQLRMVYPWFDGFVANSQAVAEYYRDADGLPAEKLTVIPNGVRQLEAAECDPRLAGRRESGPVVGIVAGLNRRVKRVDLFLHAAAEVRARRDDVSFVIVGDGILREELEALAGRLGLSDAVWFAGRTDRVGPLLAGFDVSVCCSDSEGLPNAVLEAMSAGIPVVATAVGGSPELVRDGHDGLLVDPDDPEKLGAALLRLTNDDSERRALGQRAAQTVRERFSIENCVRGHERLYRRLVDGSESGPQ
ncbi:MAG: glycosyltransferase [bacterium]|nr:glycosyltransferase [bacterium]